MATKYDSSANKEISNVLPSNQLQLNTTGNSVWCAQSKSIIQHTSGFVKRVITIIAFGQLSSYKLKFDQF